MKNVKVYENLSMFEIVRILSTLSEIDTIADIEKNEGEGEHPIAKKWLSQNNIEENQDLVRSVFRGVHNYLAYIADRDPAQFKDLQIARGIYSLMMFVMEAGDKIEKTTPLFKQQPLLETISDLPEYRELHEFYISAVSLKLPPPAEFEDRWEVEWGIKNQDLSDIKSFALRTSREVCMDGQFELFYILSENGRPFYDYDVIRHMRMLYDFDRASRKMELDNLFHKVDIVTDRECHTRSLSIIKNCYYLIDEFFKEAFKYKESVCVSNLCSAVMGLMLAANVRNLKQTSTSDKTAYGYFLDFQFHLRKAIDSDEYQKLINLSNDRRPFQANLYLLVHKLVFSYFTHCVDHREMSAVLRRLVSEGFVDLGRNEDINGRHFSLYLHEDEALRRSLEKYPAGAIHKLAEVFSYRQNNRGFDPFSQENIPEKLFQFMKDDKEVGCLHMPCPVKQEFIQKAEIVMEFHAFLRSFTLASVDQRILIINLQSRTSWQDFARCIALEEMLKLEGNARKISMLGLPKNTEFYHQSEGYAELNDATTFIKQFHEQIVSQDHCGYYFSSDLVQVITSKIDQILSMVHEVCFDGKLSLGRYERRDFIEVTYLFMTFISLGYAKADYITFMDKCSLDAGAICSAEWLGFVKLVSESPMTDEEKGLFYYIMHAHAFILRERAADQDLTRRSLFALVRLEKAIMEKNELFKQRCSQIGFCNIKM
ncbi:MAG: hypothetical protein FJZ57_06930 [Chlamydiae bacterium]|nr:hypothetical protein [Chlamydiota bacterium]